jgi:hypothetical protein
MSNDNDDDDIDLEADAAESRRGIRPKRRIVQVIKGDDERHPGAQHNDIFFPGARPGTEYIPGLEGFNAQMLKEGVETFQLFEADPYTGRWKERIGDETPTKPRGMKFDKPKKGFFDHDGNAVLRKVYLDFLRHGDPLVYTMLFEGPATSVYDKWIAEASTLTNASGKALALYAARYHWSLIEFEGAKQGAKYTQWVFELLALFGDSSPEAPNKAEYRAARAAAAGRLGGGAAASEAGRTVFTSGRQIPPPYDGPLAPPPASESDYGDLPDWMR